MNIQWYKNKTVISVKGDFVTVCFQQNFIHNVASGRGYMYVGVIGWLVGRLVDRLVGRSVCLCQKCETNCFNSVRQIAVALGTHGQYLCNLRVPVSDTHCVQFVHGLQSYVPLDVCVYACALRDIKSPSHGDSSNSTALNLLLYRMTLWKLFAGNYLRLK